MQRYSVTIVSPGVAANDRPTLIVPFQPTVLVQAFIDELWKRVIRQNIPLAPNTHIATLHIDSETGAIIDCEDVLADVIDPKEKLFAVFAGKCDEPATPAAALNSISKSEETVSIRIITPALAKNRDACPVIHIPIKSTIRQMHGHIAEHLHIRPKLDDDPELLECNCKLATDLSSESSSLSRFLVVHGKSIVERLELHSATEVALREALRRRFGADIEARKRVHLYDAVLDAQHPGIYLKTPVVQICSKARHSPRHARVTYEEDDQPRYKVLDLHTSEQPINPACFSSTIADAGLAALARDNIIDIFAVNRTATCNHSATVGKSSIYRSRPHWEPEVLQSDRGVAMFLSSLRVFVSLIQDMKDDERAQDAVLHALDLLTNFTPAVRAIHILMKGNTINSAESTAISHALFEVLDDFLPTAIVGSDQSRLFEGARLLFGFILDKARSLKLPQGEGAIMPYLSSIQALDLRDHKTNEGVLDAVQTTEGLIEASLFDAYQEGGVLSTAALPLSMMKTEIEISKSRQALLGGGRLQELTVFSVSNMMDNYRYLDAGNVAAAVDLEELTDLSHLAELAGRNKLAVHKPAQLASAVAPCLTFDSKAHLSVYTGEQPCGIPGHSSLIFRPMHGEETIDTAVVEQLIAPIIQTYQADGTAVFDALGGAIVRMLEAPDEIVIFAVDTSASMRQPTDFLGVNEDHLDCSYENGTHPLVDAHFYARATFEAMKERLSSYEGFEDMIAIVGAISHQVKQIAAGQVLETLRNMLASEIEQKAKALADSMRRGYGLHVQQADLDTLKTFWAGLKTFDGALCDFLVYRSTMLSTDINRRWNWSLNDAPPNAGPAQHIPNLPEDLTDLPHNLRCPISHALMEDAVTAADGHSYSEAAIRQWFNIRSSSPMTGLVLDSTLLQPALRIREAAQRWAEGDGISARLGGEHKRLKSSNDVTISFDSKIGTFQRTIPSQIAVRDLYKLAFRGLKGRYATFQLSTDVHGPMRVLPQHSNSYNFEDGDHISVRIAEDDPTTPNMHDSGNSSSTGYALIKVFKNKKDVMFAYWAKRDNFVSTFASVMWKYHRYHYRNFGDRHHPHHGEKQVWMKLEDSGDGLSSGDPRETSDRLATYFTS